MFVTPLRGVSDMVVDSRSCRVVVFCFVLYQAFSYVNDVETFSAMDKVSNQVSADLQSCAWPFGPDLREWIEGRPPMLSLPRSRLYITQEIRYGVSLFCLFIMADLRPRAATIFSCHVARALFHTGSLSSSVRSPGRYLIQVSKFTL